MKAIQIISSVSILLIVHAWVAVDSFSPWQHLRQQTWGVPHLPRRLRRFIPRPHSVRDDENEKGKNNYWKQLEWKPSKEEGLKIALGIDSGKLEPRRPSIPPPEDLEPLPWKPFFVDMKRNTTIDQTYISNEVDTVSTSVAEPTITEHVATISESSVPTDSVSATTTPAPLFDPTTPTPLFDPETQEEIVKAANLIRETFMTQVVEPLLSQPVQKNVPSDAIRGAALTAATLSLVASKSLLFSGVAGLSAAYMAIAPGTVGDSLRLLGTGAWGTTQFLSESLVSSNLLGNVTKIMLATSIEAIRQLATSIEQGSTEYNSTTSIQSNQLAEQNQMHADVEQVLLQAQDAMRAAEEAMQQAPNDSTDVIEPELSSYEVDNDILNEIESADDEQVTQTIDDDFEVVDDLQQQLGEEDSITTDVVASEADPNEDLEAFLDEVPAGMEDESDAIALRDDRDLIYEDDDDEIEAANEDLEAGNEFYEREDIEESFEVFSEDDFEEAFSEDDLKDDRAIFSDELPEGLEAEDKDDIFVLDEEPEFVVGDLDESGIEAQESSAVFGDLAPDDLPSQEYSDFAMLDEDPDLGLGIADDDTDNQGQASGDKGVIRSEEVGNEVMSDVDWEASIRLAQKGLEGTIVGIDEAVSDVDEKANWDAAKRLAQVLSQQEKEQGDVDKEDDVDMEALGRAARDAVERFEEQRKKEQDEMRLERKKWESEMVTSSTDDYDSETLTSDDDNLEEIAAAARAAVDIFEAQRARSDSSTDVSDQGDLDASGTGGLQKKKSVDSVKKRARKGRQKDEPHEEAILQTSGDDENQSQMNEEELQKIARAARAAVEMFEAQQKGAFFDDIPDINGAFLREDEENVQSASTSSETLARDWSILSTSQLKEELKERGLSTKGKKADLVAALEEYEAVLAAEFDFPLGQADDEGLDSFSFADFNEFVNGDSSLSALASTDGMVWDWSTLSSTELKEELKLRGLSTKGKKADLIAALVENDALFPTPDDGSESQSILDQDGLSDRPGDDLRFMDTAEPSIVVRDWSQLTTTELKEELKALGLSVKGKKSDLVARLIEFDDRAGEEDIISPLQPDLAESPIDSPAFEPSDEALLQIEREESSLLSNDLSDEYDNMGVAQLKEELRKRGLRVGGRKDELIQRLRSSD